MDAGMRSLDLVATSTSCICRRIPPQLSEAGVKRVSVGGALSRLALATVTKAARAMQERGSFAWMRDMIGMPEVVKMLS
jgi:2-methylisocitrate lyase-like PEP mutase family enzyme